MAAEQAFRAIDKNNSGRVGFEDIITIFGIKFELIHMYAVAATRTEPW